MITFCIMKPYQIVETHRLFICSLSQIRGHSSVPSVVRFQRREKCPFLLRFSRSMSFRNFFLIFISDLAYTLRAFSVVTFRLFPRLVRCICYIFGSGDYFNIFLLTFRLPLSD